MQPKSEFRKYKISKSWSTLGQYLIFLELNTLPFNHFFMRGLIGWYLHRALTTCMDHSSRLYRFLFIHWQLFIIAYLGFIDYKALRGMRIHVPWNCGGVRWDSSTTVGGGWYNFVTSAGCKIILFEPLWLNGCSAGPATCMDHVNDIYILFGGAPTAVIIR